MLMFVPFCVFFFPHLAYRFLGEQRLFLYLKFLNNLYFESIDKLTEKSQGKYKEVFLHCEELESKLYTWCSITSKDLNTYFLQIRKDNFLQIRKDIFLYKYM